MSLGNKKLKLDLHTHCHEATRMVPPSLEVAERIVAAVKAKGLDGIAITEHWDKFYGYKIKELVEQHLNGEVVIIPGQEIDIGRHQEVELYLPDGSVFKFWVHPHLLGNPDGEVGDIQGIELDNALHNWHIDKKMVMGLAAKYDLLLLANSDAHYLDNIGEFYNEISLEELSSRSQTPRSKSEHPK